MQIIYVNLYTAVILMVIGLIGTGWHLYQYNNEMTVGKLILTFIVGLIPYINLIITIAAIAIWQIERPKTNSFLDKVLF